MADELISVEDVATQLGISRPLVHKITKRLGIEGDIRRDPSKRNAHVKYITQADLNRVRDEALRTMPSSSQQTNAVGNGDLISTEQGVFYVVQLEPEHDPNRFKVGFASNMPERLRALCCSAPFAKVVQMWPCKRRWEKTAIDFVTWDCEQLHTEVFRNDSLNDVIAKCEAFFAISPPVDAREQT